MPISDRRPYPACVASAPSATASGLSPERPQGSALRWALATQGRQAGSGHTCPGTEERLPLTVYLPVDAALFKGHDILGERPRLVRENVMDLPELLVQRGGPRLCGCVLLRVVHLQVPVYEVTLSKTDHFHTGKTEDLLSVEFSETSGRSDLLVYKDASQVVAHVPRLWVLLVKCIFL